MTIMYLTFGQKTEYHMQAYLSMLSFRRQMSSTDHIVMVTTDPEFYHHILSWADVVSISDELVCQWQGTHQFFWRAKIKAIEFVGSKYPNDDLLYLDCDTVLLGSIDWIRQHMANGQGLMDRDEGHPMNMKTKTLRMWKTIAGHTYGGITLGEQHHMFCAGVVGIPQSRLQQIVTTALALCDGMLDDEAERIVIEQYSLSVAVFEHAGLTETKDCIAHYWATKDEWMQAASELIARAHLTSANANEELRLFDSVDWHALPVYAHKSNTARRLHHLIDKTFPDRDHRYIKG